MKDFTAYRMASEPETTERGETLAPNLAPQHGSRGNTPANSEAPRKNIPEHCSAGQRGKKRKHLECLPLYTTNAHYNWSVQLSDQ